MIRQRLCGDFHSVDLPEGGSRYSLVVELLGRVRGPHPVGLVVDARGETLEGGSTHADVFGYRDKFGVRPTVSLFLGLIGVDGVVVLARESLVDRTTPRADRAIGGIVSEVAVQERGRTPNDPRDAGLGCFGDALAVRFFEGAAGRALEVFPQFENGGVVPGGSIGNPVRPFAIGSEDTVGNRSVRVRLNHINGVRVVVCIPRDDGDSDDSGDNGEDGNGPDDAHGPLPAFLPRLSLRPSGSRPVAPFSTTRCHYISVRDHMAPRRAPISRIVCLFDVLMRRARTGGLIAQPPRGAPQRIDPPRPWLRRLIRHQGLAG